MKVIVMGAQAPSESRPARDNRGLHWLVLFTPNVCSSQAYRKEGLQALDIFLFVGRPGRKLLQAEFHH